MLSALVRVACLAATASALAAVTPAARLGVSNGVTAFRRGDVAESVAQFDAALAESPVLGQYLWQRGISLYYAERYADGAAQFAADVALNPNDTEESIWHMLCKSRQQGVGFDAARTGKLKVGSDPRPIMRAADEMFAGAGSADVLATKGAKRPGSSDEFYADLYLGLYAEAQSHPDLARMYITRAVDHPYARGSDYMVDVARVHKKVRGW